MESRITCSCLLLLSGGCYDFAFVYENAVAEEAMAPRDLEMRYSANEDLTGVVWTADRDAEPEIAVLEVILDGVTHPIAEYVATATREDELLAFGLIIPGHPGIVDLRLVDPRPEHSRSFRAVANYEQYDLGVTVTFAENNRSLSAEIVDPFHGFVAGDLRRELVLRLLDSTCRTELAAATIDGSSAQIDTLGLLGDDDVYCAGVEGGGRRVDSMVQARPEVAYRDEAYDAPVQTSRVVVVPVLDLVVPDAVRCAAVQQNIIDAISQGALAIAQDAVVTAPIAPLPDAYGYDEGDSTNECRQTPNPYLPVDELVSRALDLLQQPGSAAVLVLYFQDIDTALPSTLTDSFRSATTWAQSQGGELQVASIGPDAATSSFEFVASDLWTYADDPELGDRIRNLMQALLPYRRCTHDPEDMVPLFADGSAAGFLGYKVCQATPSVYLLGDIGLPYVPLSANGEAGYWVSFPTGYQSQLVFTPPVSTLSAELCWRYCDRYNPIPWVSTRGCML